MNHPVRKQLKILIKNNLHADEIWEQDLSMYGHRELSQGCIERMLR